MGPAYDSVHRCVLLSKAAGICEAVESGSLFAGSRWRQRVARISCHGDCCSRGRRGRRCSRPSQGRLLLLTLGITGSSTGKPSRFHLGLFGQTNWGQTLVSSRRNSIAEPIKSNWISAHPERGILAASGTCSCWGRGARPAVRVYLFAQEPRECFTARDRMKQDQETANL